MQQRQLSEALEESARHYYPRAVRVNANDLMCEFLMDLRVGMLDT